MAEESTQAPDFDDAKLLNMVRAGDSAAFGVLYQRHADAARRLARDLVVSPAEIDEIVADTFARVLEALQRGGGPTDGFRPYLLTATRRVCYARFSSQRTLDPAGGQPASDPGQLLLEPANAGLHDALIVRAFLSLPERWSALLWHTEIEQESPEDVAPLFGLSFNGVSALEKRAREGIRQAYLEMHIAQGVRPECAPISERFAAFLRYTLSLHETSAVAEHLSDCADCRAVYSDLADVGATLRETVAPLFLGSAAASYLSGAGYDPPAGAVAGTTSSPPAELHGLALGAMAAWGSDDATHVLMPGQPDLLADAESLDEDEAPPRAPLLGWLAQASDRQRRLLAAGCAVLLVAIAGVALAATLTGHRSPPRSSTAAGPPGITAPKQSDAVSPTPATPSAAASSASPTPSASPPPSPSAVVLAPATTSPPAAELDAGVNIYGQNHNSFVVVFQVTDTGSGATGALTAAITLPAGTSMGPGWPGGQANMDQRMGGWTCQATSSGATCSHSPLSPGQGSYGAIHVQQTSSSACGQPVLLTVTSGSASASAQSPISCGQQAMNGNGLRQPL